MTNLWNRIVSYQYFKEIAFILAVLLILGAWKFGIEGLGE